MNGALRRPACPWGGCSGPAGPQTSLLWVWLPWTTAVAQEQLLEREGIGKGRHLHSLQILKPLVAQDCLDIPWDSGWPVPSGHLCSGFRPPCLWNSTRQLKSVFTQKAIAVARGGDRAHCAIYRAWWTTCHMPAASGTGGARGHGKSTSHWTLCTTWGMEVQAAYTSKNAKEISMLQTQTCLLLVTKRLQSC